MNKRRIWATSPVYYVMAAVMFIMACFSYTQNKILLQAVQIPQEKLDAALKSLYLYSVNAVVVPYL